MSEPTAVRRIPLRGGLTIDYVGLYGFAAVVMGAGLLIAHKGAAPITVGALMLLGGLVSFFFTVRRK